MSTSVSFRQPLSARIARLSPGSFAAVMATGIVSIDLELHGMPILARGLLFINVVLWLGLLAASLWRLLAWPERMWADFRNPARGASFLTLAAGTLVLAGQFVMVVDCPPVARALTLAGGLFWLLLLYPFLAVTMTARQKAGFMQSLNGGWLILVVATQAVSVAISQLAPSSPLLQFLSLNFYLLGAMLYVILITLLFYRMVFFHLPASDLTPPYWINMGALAITTLAGSLLVLHPAPGLALTELLSFLRGLTVFFWATATWWIPLLLLLGWWRHVRQRFPLRYDISYWNIVFPVSMYMVGSHQLAAAADVPFLRSMTAVGVHLGFVIWLLAALAGLHALWRPDPAPGGETERKTGI